MFIDRRTDTLCYIDTIALLHNEKKRNIDTCNKINESQNNYAEYKKPERNSEV